MSGYVEIDGVRMFVADAPEARLRGELSLKPWGSGEGVSLAFGEAEEAYAVTSLTNEKSQPILLHAVWDRGSPISKATRIGCSVKIAPGLIPDDATVEILGIHRMYQTTDPTDWYLVENQLKSKTPTEIKWDTMLAPGSVAEQIRPPHIFQIYGLIRTKEVS